MLGIAVREFGVRQGAYEHIGVIGGGAWGTALALAAARAGRHVSLWARGTEAVQSLRTQRQNIRYLPGIKMPDAIAVTAGLSEAASADALLLVVPAQHIRSILSALRPVLGEQIPLIVCAKGLERSSGKLMTEVVGEFVGEDRIGILSGPSFARDVALGLPTAVTVAAPGQTAQRLQWALGSTTFRPYASDDVVGVALGGAAKNVYAIACGIVAGMGLGESARAALLARSFAELRRLGEALGAKPETLMGLSGLGDLVLTASSSTSRNFSFGFAIGKGRTRAELDAQGHPLAEGVETAPALVARAARQGIELPIAETAAAILDGSLPLDAAMARLMERPLKAE
ncbi:MAG: NAD(P)-dependent glycerol-3-phosphate dehydrogenase [Alphaproteobacteria bacterium]|nr:NAD(P)-dependent glycerol-3-phosphate dehydrogenase [Alphaproteobacteria bacterium]